MKIKFWGCRGSIPTPGYDTNKYGGNTTCVEIRLNDGTLIIIDAGTGIRKLGKTLLKEKNLKDIYLFLTHAHWDHLQGFPFFAPAYMADYTIHVRGGPLAMQSLEKFLSHQMHPPFFPVNFELLQAHLIFDRGNPAEQSIGNAKIIPIPLDHPNGGYGYKFCEDGSTFVFLTDNELEFGHKGGLNISDYLEISKGADLLVHDAQYTDDEYTMTRGWGHSTLKAATHLSIDAGVKRLGLFHHDPDHTDRDIDRYVQYCRDMISKKKSNIECFGAREEQELTL